MLSHCKFVPPLSESTFYGAAPWMAAKSALTPMEHRKMAWTAYQKPPNRQGIAAADQKQPPTDIALA
jgi:hypothetical protein